MNVSVKKGKRRCCVTVRGDMTIYTALELKQAVMGPVSAGRDLEVDLSRVRSIDTAGLQILFGAKREVVQGGKEFNIVSSSQEVQEAMSVCGMAEKFRMGKDRKKP